MELTIGAFGAAKVLTDRTTMQQINFYQQEATSANFNVRHLFTPPVRGIRKVEYPMLDRSTSG